MRFHTRKWVKPEDLNPNKTLFGGKLLAWIDEEAALYSIVQLENPHVVTKFMSEINFMASAQQGDIVEIGIDVISFGRTSLVLRCEVRNKMTHETIITVDRITMVNLDENGKPKPHGKTQVEYVKDRLSAKDSGL
ncbi:acyl-CoA thioesterase [Flavobacterium agricola]|uniref:Acyl-CoA thioesterase n=1 Tax=Flavobacterium agricola TaxID=2870839 RepID=A0ABY6M4I1_9FLAO|nr:hotdog domain-containing protein [Flavobacterium agricola]UYW02286.1 acyl-CoA thioesterase [Flavobacterium agricola]